jgi:hypothetical protein
VDRRRRPFEGSWHRVDRATAHRDAAVTDWNAFLAEDEDPFDFTLKGDDQGHFTLSVYQAAPIPPLIAIRLGEWLYNLRTALDYCVYDVAVCDTGQNPPPDDGKLLFPIQGSAAAFREKAYQIKPLSKQHRGWIETVQPYQGGDPERTALFWLNELARIDRHRALHVVGGYIAASTPTIEAPAATTVLFEEVPFVPFIDGETVIARFQVIPYRPGDKVYANPHTGIHPELAEWASRRLPRLGLGYLTFDERLLHIETIVKVIIGQFERDCLGHTRPDAAKLLKPNTEE